MKNIEAGIRMPGWSTCVNLSFFPLVGKRRGGGWFARRWWGAEGREETGVNEVDGIAGVAFGSGGCFAGYPLEGAGAVGGAMLDGFD